jgi:hypothetical protein
MGDARSGGGAVKRPSSIHFQLMRTVVLLCVVLCCAALACAQNNGSERSFPQSKATVEKILLQMQSSTAGRLPVLEGFALAPSAEPLDRYQRGYFQSKFQVTSTPSGGSTVRVVAEVTAWYTDPSGAKSGYQLLPSNGRLEADMLDQLAEQLAGQLPAQTVAKNSPVVTPVPKQTTKATPAPADEPSVSAPMPRLPEVGSGLSASVKRDADTQPNGNSGSKTATAKNDAGPLETQAENLEEILKNQAHPKNLVAVKKSGTPVVASASLNAKTLFLASAHDEFEMLDYNRDWVHVRISGLSRGWIWRNSLEMPNSVPNTDSAPTASIGPGASDLYHISREEVALFPGDWQPLRGKSVKIVSVEQIGESKDSSSQPRLAFAKSVLENDYAELAQKKQELAGIVLIFDAADGGMIAATFPILQQWKAGMLSDAALWHQCYFDPPEIMTGSSAGASQ